MHLDKNTCNKEKMSPPCCCRCHKWHRQGSAWLKGCQARACLSPHTQ